MPPRILPFPTRILLFQIMAPLMIPVMIGITILIIPRPEPPASTLIALPPTDIPSSEITPDDVKIMWNAELPPHSTLRAANFAEKRTQKNPFASKITTAFVAQLITNTCDATKSCETRITIFFDNEPKNSKTTHALYRSYRIKACLMNEKSTLILSGTPKIEPVLSCPTA